MKLLFVIPAAHLVALTYAVNLSSTSSLGPVVDLGYALYAGNTTSPAGLEDGPVVFYGNIPYALPPIGDLRWRAPRMLNEEAQTSQVVDARGWGPPCLQHPAMVGIGSEGLTPYRVSGTKLNSGRLPKGQRVETKECF